VKNELRDKVIRLVVKLERIQDKARWKLSNFIQLMFNEDISMDKRANFLVVVDERYLDAAEVAVNSFLSHHHDYIAIIHTDKALIMKVESFVAATPFARKIQIRLIDKQQDWRLSKLMIIEEMVGTFDYYLDVDTRSNGKFPNSKQILFFVDEGPTIKGVDLNTVKTEYKMLNTTIFSWSGIRPSYPNEIFELFRLLENNFKGTEKERLIEQMALSIFVQENNYKYTVLKVKDHSFDGGILESSYLGATGRQIYRR